jgi:hypothetical protein
MLHQQLIPCTIKFEVRDIIRQSLTVFTHKLPCPLDIGFLNEVTQFDIIMVHTWIVQSQTKLHLLHILINS